jgi:hypothetical protein
MVVMAPPKSSRAMSGVDMGTSEEQTRLEMLQLATSEFYGLLRGCTLVTESSTAEVESSGERSGPSQLPSWYLPYMVSGALPLEGPIVLLWWFPNNYYHCVLEKKKIDYCLHMAFKYLTVITK